MQFKLILLKKFYFVYLLQVDKWKDEETGLGKRKVGVGGLEVTSIEGLTLVHIWHCQMQKTTIHKS